MLVGLTVTDDRVYQEYRDAMTPLLASHGGGFRFDFVVGQVLRSEATHPINRVFAIYFADAARKDAFFGHAEYRVIRARFFERSVTGVTILAAYDR